MKYHIVLHREMDLNIQSEQAQQGKSPRHAMWQLKERLEASIHTPYKGLKINRLDRFRSKFVGSPENWALARELVKKMGAEDTIFCNSEVCGIPIATLCRGQKNRPNIAIFVHNLDRPRGRFALRLTGAASCVDWFAACSQHQVDFLKQYLKLPDEQATFVWDQTDLSFFSPGSPNSEKTRPLVMSVGLEQRDYRTLAAATADLPIDVKISGFSRDADTLAKAFPETMPTNMNCQFYAWTDLQQLYRDADVVVVSTFPNRYAAGVQAMMEAMACGRPTIVTSTVGLYDYLFDNDGVMQVPPGDASAMRQAITQLLEQPQKAERLSKQALHIAQTRYDSEHHVEYLAQGLEAISNNRHAPT